MYWWPDDLIELEKISLSTKTIGRPGERSQPGRLPHIVHVNADVHEAAPVAARQADGRFAAGVSEQRAHPGAIEAGTRVRIQICAAQRDERWNRCIDIERRRSIQREINFLFVLVLRPERASPACSRGHTQQRYEQEGMSCAGRASGTHKSE